MSKTKEGLPVVMEGTARLVATKIREIGTEALFVEMAHENPKLAQAIELIIQRRTKETDRTEVKQDMVTVYEFLRSQGELDQNGNGNGNGRINLAETKVDKQNGA